MIYTMPRYVDYTGRNDQYRPYQRMYHAKNNDVWLYDDLYGARRGEIRQ
jgi:hypothetical protein